MTYHGFLPDDTRNDRFPGDEPTETPKETTARLEAEADEREFQRWCDVQSEVELRRCCDYCEPQDHD